MATILTFRKDGPLPCCELMLDNGDPVRISFDAAGMTIERLPRRGAPPTTLVRASADAIAWICATLQQDRRGKLVDAFDIVVGLVGAMPSAEAVRAAFVKALAEHHRRNRSSWPAWLRWFRWHFNFRG